MEEDVCAQFFSFLRQLSHRKAALTLPLRAGSRAGSRGERERKIIFLSRRARPSMSRASRDPVAFQTRSTIGEQNNR